MIPRAGERDRLVKRGAERAPLLKRYRGSRTSFATLHTVADVLLLVHTDSLHGTLSGPATRAVAVMEQGRVVDLDLATALRHRATLWTQDSDFDGLPGTRYHAKR